MKVWTAWSRLALVAGVSGLSMLLIACGSGGSPAAAPVRERGTVSSPEVNTPTPTPTPAAQQTTAAPTPTPTAPPVAGRTSSPSLSAREIKVTLKDNTFPEEIRVKVGERVVFVVTNNSEAGEKHNFEIPDFDVAKEIRPDETVRIEWLVPNKKGKWDVGCYRTEEGYHEGMEGTLVIE